MHYTELKTRWTGENLKDSASLFPSLWQKPMFWEKMGEKGLILQYACPAMNRLRTIRVGTCVHTTVLDSLSPMQYSILIKFIFDLGFQNILWGWFPPFNYMLPGEVCLKTGADALIPWLYYKRWTVILYHIIVLLIYLSHILFIFFSPEIIIVQLVASTVNHEGVNLIKPGTSLVPVCIKVQRAACTG